MSGRQPQRPPVTWPQGPLGPQQLPGQGMPGVTADTQGASIEPWLTANGQTAFTVEFEPISFDPRASGIQLVCSKYVPRGRVAFIKQLWVAPFIPPVLVDPWTTTGVAAFGGTWRNPNTTVVNSGFEYAAATGGFWTTPFGWESYVVDDDPNFAPRWRWIVRYVQGNIDELRRANGKSGIFNPADPLTWEWAEGIAVPRSSTIYGGGLPGAPLGYGLTSPQKMQVTPDAPLTAHWMAPEDTTVCLFALWDQGQILPQGADANGPINYTQNQVGDDQLVYPLLPSFGRMHGYMQANGTAVAEQNAAAGWGG